MARLLYFASLVDRLGRATEEVQLPDAITDVRTLLAWLRTRGQPWAQVLMDDAVRVTVNKQFVTLDGRVQHKDEIAFVPTRAS